jgi:hypothetical protein
MSAKQIGTILVVLTLVGLLGAGLTAVWRYNIRATECAKVELATSAEWFNDLRTKGYIVVPVMSWDEERSNTPGRKYLCTIKLSASVNNSAAYGNWAIYQLEPEGASK